MHATIDITPVAPVSASFWNRRISPILDRHFLLLCGILVAIGCLRVIATYNTLSLTTDEPTDYVCGLEYLTSHTYTLGPQHPPLSRMAHALGPYLFGARITELPVPRWGELPAFALTGHPQRTVFLMRLGNLPFYILSCLVVCGWSWYAFGKPAAVLATALFTQLPEPLMNAGLGTTDTALAANVGAAFLAAVLWARRPTWIRAIAMGVFTAFACLSKFTALGYIPICLAISFLCYLVVQRPRLRWLWSWVIDHFLTFVAALMVAALVVWGCYFFSVGSHVSHRFHLTLPVPAPAFVSGLQMQLFHNTRGHGASLFNQFSWHGWWYYLLIGLAVKTPIPIIMLTLLGLYVCFKQYARPLYLLPACFALGILLPASFGHIDIGIRYIEPLWMSASILSALGLMQLFQWRPKPLAGLLAGCSLVAWLVISVALQHPDYLSYFNAFAGSKPEEIMVDSNYDWGQDIKLLANRLHALGAQHVALAVTLDAGNRDPREVVDPHYALFQSWYGLPPSEQADVCVPAPGWNVVSTTVEKSLSYWPQSRFYRGPGNPLQWYEKVSPTDRVGPLLLFNVPAGSQLRSENCVAQGTSGPQ
ncbi:MAG: hypothetical protein WBX19_19060 [Terracidiphilus sp.]